MNKIEIYNTNTKNHEKMLYECTKLRLKVVKSNNFNALYIERSTNSSDELSGRFLTILAEVISENLGFLIFQALKISDEKLALDREEALKESKNFINSCEAKHK